MKFRFGFIAIFFICIYSIFPSKAVATPVPAEATPVPAVDSDQLTKNLSLGFLCIYRIVVSCCIIAHKCITKMYSIVDFNCLVVDEHD